MFNEINTTISVQECGLTCWQICKLQSLILLVFYLLLLSHQQDLLIMSWHFHLGKKANNKALQNIILYANAVLFKDINETCKKKIKKKTRTYYKSPQYIFWSMHYILYTVSSHSKIEIRCLEFKLSNGLTAVMHAQTCPISSFNLLIMLRAWTVKWNPSWMALVFTD